MRFRTLLFIASIAQGAAAATPSLDDIAAALENMAGYAATVNYAVTLPQADDDIVYTVTLQQPADPDSYLIDWTVDSPSGPVHGFTAWFEGHFYDFRNRRLREHHADWDAAAPQGAREPQNSAQFSSLLPSRMATQLRALAGPGFSYRLTPAAGNVLRLDAVRLSAGEPDAELSWTFDAATLRPREFAADYNPGAISAQQVMAVFTDTVPSMGRLDEAALRLRYPDVFARCRESQFAIEQMRGASLPAFSLPLADGSGRLERQATQGFERPTLLVLFDPASTLAPRLAGEVREAVDRMPADVDVIWASTGKDRDAMAELLGPARRGETAVCAAAGLAADCGAATLPVTLACAPDGRIGSLIIGLNNQFATDVICMLTTMKK